MCAGVVPFFAGVGVVAEKDEGEMSTGIDMKTFKPSFVLFSIASTGECGR